MIYFTMIFFSFANILQKTSTPVTCVCKEARSEDSIFLGAGASCDAGYPLTKKVIERIGEYAKSQKNCFPFSEYWERFNQLKDIRGDFEIILDSQNPELILTIPDLIKSARPELENKFGGNYLKELNEKQANELCQQEIQSIWDKNFDLKKLKFCQKMEDVADGFQHVLSDYFCYEHYADFLEGINPADGKEPRYSYLSKAFNKLKRGDTIISTNWDTSAERVLMNMKKWYPWDGYGVDIDMEVYDQVIIRRGGKKPNLSKLFKKESKVKVLKLHGSIGWYYESREDRKLHLSYSLLQNLIPPECGNEKIREKNTDNSGGHHEKDKKILILPSYIKNLDDTNLQSIWYQAGEALKSAENIFFVGYSLPSADVAIRALINPLKYRIENNEVKKVVVIVGENSVKEEKNWLDFLGNKIIVEKVNAATYFNQY